MVGGWAAGLGNDHSYSALCLAQLAERLFMCCRNLAINLDEGGMPWTCLPGEPSNVNWCNAAGGADLYKNPPLAWRGANQHGVHTLKPLFSILAATRCTMYCGA